MISIEMKKLFQYSTKLTGIILSFFIINSCGITSTVITGSWEKSDVDKIYDNLVVEAFTAKEEVEEALELHMAQKLNEKGIYATINEELLPPAPVENDQDKQGVMDNVRRNGADGILTISIINREAESRYVPGFQTYAPYPRFPYYRSFWRYYNYWYPYFHKPGYYRSENVYYIETNLFDAESEELIWSVQSKTYEQANLEIFSKDYAKEVVELMIREGIIKSVENEKERIE